MMKRYYLLCILFNSGYLVFSQDYDVELYTTTPAIRFGHAIPPVRQFDMTQSYYTTTLYFPIALAIAGILAVIAFQNVWCYYPCNRSDSSTIDSESITIYERQPALLLSSSSLSSVLDEKKKRNYQIAVVLFFLFLSFIFVLDIIAFKSRSTFINSITTAKTSMTDLASVFAYINSDATALIQNVNSINHNVNTGYCHVAFKLLGVDNDLQRALNKSRKSFQQIANMTVDISPRIIQGRDTITTQVDPYVPIVFWVYLSVSVFWVFILTAVYFAKRKWILMVGIVSTEILIVVMMILQAVGMNAVKIGGDACTNPSASLITAATTLHWKNQTIRIFQYFTTCRGYDPFLIHFNDSLQSLKQFNQSFDAYYYPAMEYLEFVYNSPYSPKHVKNVTACLTAIGSEKRQLYSNMDLLLSRFECPKIYAIWQQLVQHSVCQQAYSTGIYKLWIVILLTSVLMFMALICASYFYDHFLPPVSIDTSNSSNNNYNSNSYNVNGYNQLHTNIASSSSSIPNSIPNKASNGPKINYNSHTNVIAPTNGALNEDEEEEGLWNSNQHDAAVTTATAPPAAAAASDYYNYSHHHNHNTTQLGTYIANTHSDKKSSIHPPKHEDMDLVLATGRTESSGSSNISSSNNYNNSSSNSSSSSSSSSNNSSSRSSPRTYAAAIALKKLITRTKEAQIHSIIDDNNDDDDDDDDDTPTESMPLIIPTSAIITSTPPVTVIPTTITTMTASASYHIYADVFDDDDDDGSNDNDERHPLLLLRSLPAQLLSLHIPSSSYASTAGIVRSDPITTTTFTAATTTTTTTTPLTGIATLTGSTMNNTTNVAVLSPTTTHHNIIHDDIIDMSDDDER